MKLLIAFSAILMLSLTIPPRSRIMPAPEKPLEQVLKEEGIKKLSRLLRSLKHTNFCPFRNMNGVLASFDYSAAIAVSSQTNPAGTQYAPADYFRNLEALRCGAHKAYSDMKFTYLPIDTARDVRVNMASSGERHEVTIQFNQLFKGSGPSGNDYCDITIKKATLHFWQDRTTHVLNGSIMKIEVVETKSCQGAGKQYTDPR